MWIVKLALRRPYTFVVMAILILVMGGIAILRTPTDIFPNIDIPVVSVIWNYNGLVPKDMADRIVSVTERNMTTIVDNIEHVESQSLYGIAVVKVFMQPNASIDRAVAQITASSQTQLRQLPPGTTPPLIIAYSASSVPVMQLALSGRGLAEQQLNDYGLNFIRTQLNTIPGTSVPYPYGGKQRQVQVDLNSSALQSKGLSALDVVNAITLQNLILPTGTSKIGSKEYDVDIPNAAPQSISDLNRIPIKTVGSTTIYLKDVAWVRDGFPPQTKVYAPFDGVITARNTDIGDLINSGSNTAPRTDLFDIAQTRTLRVYVNVPEEYSQGIKPGQTVADVALAEFPEKRFPGKLVRTSESINATTRTLLVEVDLDNPGGNLFSGSYAEVHLNIAAQNSTYLLPVSALIFRSEKLQVGVVRNGKVAVTDVTPGHDFGDRIEIVAGLKADDQVVLNPPDSLVSGQQVTIVQAALPGDPQ